jgi:hypothetical protein
MELKGNVVSLLFFLEVPAIENTDLILAGAKFP